MTEQQIKTHPHSGAWEIFHKPIITPKCLAKQDISPPATWSGMKTGRRMADPSPVGCSSSEQTQRSRLHRMRLRRVRLPGVQDIDQRTQIPGDHFPEQRPIYLEISVNDAMTHANDLNPRGVGNLVTDGLADMPGGFADHFNALNHCALRPFIAIKDVFVHSLTKPRFQSCGGCARNQAA